jgi:hypothetical protein
MPTRWPVFPKFRVGMALVVAGFKGISEAARAAVGRVASPITAATARPPSLRNSRRFGFEVWSVWVLRIKTPARFVGTLNRPGSVSKMKLEKN